MNQQQRDTMAAAKAEMEEEERQKNFMKRATKGDASETGIVRFLTPILMQQYGGPMVKDPAHENALDQIRA